MLRRSLLLAWLIAILGILAPSIASAATAANLETRVKAFERVVPTLIGRSDARTPEKHREKSNAYDGIASGSPLAAEAGGGGTVELFHGTTQAGAESIIADGLLPVSRNTAPFPAGSFFTHAGEGGQVGASHWAASRATGLLGGAPTVLRGTLPQATFDSLTAQGLIRTGPVPGLPYFPQQTVILPGGLRAASGQIQWTIVPPIF